RVVGDVRPTAPQPGTAPTPPPVGRARPDPRRRARLLHTAGHPVGRQGRHSQSDSGRLGGGWRVRYATGPVACAFQRVGRPGAPHSGAGCGTADISAEPGHSFLGPSLIWRNAVQLI